MTPQELPDVSNTTILIYISIAISIITALATASERFAKTLGKVGSLYYEFAKRRRQAAADKRQADVGYLLAEIKDLKDHSTAIGKRVDSLEEDNQKLRGTVIEWIRWGFHVQQITAKEGIALPDPPEVKSE